jgi:hypothetical protein
MRKMVFGGIVRAGNNGKDGCVSITAHLGQYARKEYAYNLHLIELILTRSAPGAVEEIRSASAQSEARGSQ